MPVPFDPDQYTTVPTRSAAATLGLARALISAAPSRPPASQALRLTRLRDRAELLQLSWVDAGRPWRPGDLRKLDTVLDRRWRALRGRLDSCVLLGDDDHTPRAEALLGQLGHIMGFVHEEINDPHPFQEGCDVDANPRPLTPIDSNSIMTTLGCDGPRDRPLRRQRPRP